MHKVLQRGGNVQIYRAIKKTIKFVWLKMGSKLGKERWVKGQALLCYTYTSFWQQWKLVERFSEV